MRLCQTEDGRILVRSKCKSKETTLNVTELTEVASAGAQPGPQGAQGPQGETGPQGPQGIRGEAGGIDAVRCRIVESSAPSMLVGSFQVAIVQANCDPEAEIMVTWGYHFANPGTVALLRSAKLLSEDGKVADGVTVTTAGSSSYTLESRAVCCPRS